MANTLPKQGFRDRKFDNLSLPHFSCEGLVLLSGGSVWLWVFTWWLEGPCLRPSALLKGCGAGRWAGSGSVPRRARCGSESCRCSDVSAPGYLDRQAPASSQVTPCWQPLDVCEAFVRVLDASSGLIFYVGICLEGLQGW